LSTTFSYEIDPRLADLGGGWRLRLLEDGVEVGGGVFPPVEDWEDDDLASQAAYDDALVEASVWMTTR
jgi:hypothetical protein